MTKYYNVNEGIYGRPGGPYLDRQQLEVSGHGTQFVTGEELVARHIRNTGEHVTVDDITAPVVFEVDDIPIDDIPIDDTPIDESESAESAGFSL